MQSNGLTHFHPTGYPHAIDAPNIHFDMNYQTGKRIVPVVKVKVGYYDSDVGSKTSEEDVHLRKRVGMGATFHASKIPRWARHVGSRPSPDGLEEEDDDSANRPGTSAQCKVREMQNEKTKCQKTCCIPVTEIELQLPDNILKRGGGYGGNNYQMRPPPSYRVGAVPLLYPTGYKDMYPFCSSDDIIKDFVIGSSLQGRSAI